MPGNEIEVVEENKTEVANEDVAEEETTRKGTSSEKDSADTKAYVIHGSFVQSFITNSLVVYSARCVVGAFNPPVTDMVNLNQTLKGLLASSTLVSTCFAQIPVTNRVNKTGGKNIALVIIGVTFTGMAMVTTLSAFTDITTIDGFDWRCATMLASGYLIGLGSSLFPMIVNTIKWMPNLKHFSTVQSAYGSIIDSASITTPIIIYSLQSYGYAVPFGLFTGIVALGGILGAKFLQAPPYDQLKQKYSKAQAKQLAIQHGQREGTILDHDDASMWKLIKENLRFMSDRRGLALSGVMFSALGGFFGTETFLPSALSSGYGLSQGEAIYTASIANLIHIVSRLVAGKVIAKWDNKSGGLKVFLAGNGITIAAALPLALCDLPRWGLYSCVAAINMGFGLSLVPPVNILRIWSQPENESLEQFDANNVFGSLGTIGTMGGILLPLVLGLMVDQLGEAGYQYYFLLIVAMTLATAIAIPAVDFNVTHKQGERFYDKPMVLFNNMRNRIRGPQYTFSEEKDLEYTGPGGP